MSGTTSLYGIPYPTSSDTIADYPALAQTLAQTLDRHVQAGTIAVTPSSSQQTVSVTFDKAFTSAPVVVASGWVTAGGATVTTSCESITTTGFTLRYIGSTTFSNTVVLKWIAVGA